MIRKIQKNILVYIAHLKSIENNCTTLELYESMTNITRRGKTENDTKIFGCSTKSHKDYQRKRSYSIPFGEYSVSFDNSTIYINYYKLDEGIVELSNGFDFVTELKLSISKKSKSFFIMFHTITLSMLSKLILNRYTSKITS